MDLDLGYVIGTDFDAHVTVLAPHCPSLVSERPDPGGGGSQP
jgi:hypothetical protein